MILLYILTGIVTFVLLWLIFVNVMPYKIKLDNKEYVPGWLKVVLTPIAYGFVFLDIVWNIIFGSILFLQVPSKERLTLSARLEYILLNDYDWRWDIAYIICKYGIEPTDPGHCGLGFAPKEENIVRFLTDQDL